MEVLINQRAAGILMAISALLFAAGFCVLLAYNRLFKEHKLSFEKRILVFTACIIGATWCMRFMVGISGLMEGDPLSPFEEIVNSAIHTLQSFSMDEDYTLYVANGKALMEQLFKWDAMPAIYGIYVSVLNVVCPIAGGAILFAILTSIFPKIRLWILSRCFWKPICYFSELNEASLALAQSIRKSDGSLRKATIVFSDVYPKEGDEATSELIQKARFLNSVCIEDDLSTIHITRRKNKKFFLMDHSEISNLQALSAFTDKKKYSKLRKSDEIYLFCESDSNVLVEKKVRDILEANLGKDKTPSIIPIKEYQNLVCNLLKSEEVPLFKALDKKQDKANGKKTLDITILGSGSIGTAMFLNTYWCGQLLDYTLRINIVSKEKESEFKGRINHINPEILQTSDENSDLLKIYSDDNKNKSPVYFELDYIEADVCKDDLRTKLNEDRNGKRLIDSDYFVVALGSDKDNLEIADLLFKYVTINSYGKATENSGKNRQIPIAYVVYNDSLSETLKSEKSNESTSAIMYPFGSLSETYSYNNIILSELKGNAERISDAYKKRINERMKNSEALIREQYSYWANIARAIHIQYKAFCAELSIAEYHDKATKDSDSLENIHSLAWLEHRRWVAFQRSKGFRAPDITVEESYIRELPDVEETEDGNRGKHKRIDLKLHPCIVECDKNGMKSFEKDVAEKYDMLDKVYIRIKERYKDKLSNYSQFKEGDYPEHDFKDE